MARVVSQFARAWTNISRKGNVVHKVQLSPNALPGKKPHRAVGPFEAIESVCICKVNALMSRIRRSDYHTLWLTESPTDDVHIHLVSLITANHENVAYILIQYDQRC